MANVCYKFCGIRCLNFKSVLFVFNEKHDLSENFDPFEEVNPLYGIFELDPTRTLFVIQIIFGILIILL